MGVICELHKRESDGGIVDDLSRQVVEVAIGYMKARWRRLMKVTDGWLHGDGQATNQQRVRSLGKKKSERKKEKELRKRKILKGDHILTIECSMA